MASRTRPERDWFDTNADGVVTSADTAPAVITSQFLATRVIALLNLNVTSLQNAARAIAPFPLPLGLLQYFASDILDVSAPVLAAATLDVFPQEPLPKDHPIRKAPGVVLSAHRAGAVARDLRESDGVEKPADPTGQGSRDQTGPVRAQGEPQEGHR